MRILNCKSRFPNRTHPKNSHAFFLRSFVLVVCLFVCLSFCFFSIATGHFPPQRFIHALLDFPYAKWVQARRLNIFVPALTRALPLSLSPSPFMPLRRREAAGSTWAVCLHKGFLGGVDTNINFSPSLSVSATECWPLIMTWSRLWTCGWTRGLLCSSPTQKTHTMSCGHTNRWGEWENQLTSGH